MDGLKLLIADSSEEFRAALVEALCATFCVRECADGREVMQAIRNFEPDLLMLDLMLPGKDGISILQETSAAGYTPAVLATSRFVSDYVLDAAAQLGVAYVLRKPCDLKAAVDRIADMGLRLEPTGNAGPVHRGDHAGMLFALGVPAKLSGYNYLRIGIPLAAKQPDQSVTKELYPRIAAQFVCDPKNVERSIRSAITAAWLNRDERIWRLYFPPDAAGNVAKPTNAEFIKRLAALYEAPKEDEKTEAAV